MLNTGNEIFDKICNEHPEASMRKIPDGRLLCQVDYKWSVLRYSDDVIQVNLIRGDNIIAQVDIDSKKDIIGHRSHNYVAHNEMVHLYNELIEGVNFPMLMQYHPDSLI